MKNTKISVLLIEDDSIDQLAFEDLVNTRQLPYDFTITGSVAEAKDILPSDRFDVIIVDYLLGDGNAFDLLDLIGEIPIIFVTGAGDEQVAVKAMKAGVYDYLVKDLDRQYLEKLPETIENAHQHKNFIQISKGLKKPANTSVLVNSTKGIVFYTTRIGPTLAYTPHNSEFTEEDYLKMGVFFYLAVGQGNVRNYGLFELPVPGHPDSRSFVYSFDVLDPGNQDPRSRGKNYCLLAFIFPTWIREFFLHPFDLEKLIQENIKDFTALEHLKSSKIFEKILPHVFV